MHNARKKLIFRTLRLMAIQEQKDTRKDREKYKLQIKDTEVRLENKIEESRQEIEKLAELLQLIAEKKKESMETYNQITKPFKTLRLPNGF